jgi:hypothetical protein
MAILTDNPWVNTELLPVEFNFTNVNKSIVSAPYMGASEYEWGAPQRTYATIREALKESGKVVYISETGEGENADTYHAVCLQGDVERIRAILRGMLNDRCRNQGSNWSRNWEKPDGYGSWLSMRPVALITKNDKHLLNWMLHYTSRDYLKDNTDLKIGDQLAAMVINGKHTATMGVAVIGIPENDHEVTVKVFRRKFRVPVWALFHQKHSLVKMEVAKANE